jgi:hypothetical protein
VCVCVCTTCPSFHCNLLYILRDVNLHKLHFLSLCIHSSPDCSILRSAGQKFHHITSQLTFNGNPFHKMLIVKIVFN